MNCDTWSALFEFVGNTENDNWIISSVKVTMFGPLSKNCFTIYCKFKYDSIHVMLHFLYICLSFYLSQYYDTEFTLWDRFEVKGEMTLKEFIDYFQVCIFMSSVLIPFLYRTYYYIFKLILSKQQGLANMPAPNMKECKREIIIPGFYFILSLIQVLMIICNMFIPLSGMSIT